METLLIDKLLICQSILQLSMKSGDPLTQALTSLLRGLVITFDSLPLFLKSLDSTHQVIEIHFTS